mmetsp:Transcript_6257/g.15490  ORF Transcript_6257/g.15490 Transcript_6257/m.15490 type:complete len:206 (-) Transcript_6257:261-878(-)
MIGVLLVIVGLPRNHSSVLQVVVKLLPNRVHLLLGQQKERTRLHHVARFQFCQGCGVHLLPQLLEANRHREVVHAEAADAGDEALVQLVGLQQLRPQSEGRRRGAACCSRAIRIAPHFHHSVGVVTRLMMCSWQNRIFLQIEEQALLVLLVQELLSRGGGRGCFIRLFHLFHCAAAAKPQEVPAFGVITPIWRRRHYPIWGTIRV